MFKLDENIGRGAHAGCPSGACEPEREALDRRGEQGPRVPAAGLSETQRRDAARLASSERSLLASMTCPTRPSPFIFSTVYERPLDEESR